MLNIFNFIRPDFGFSIIWIICLCCASIFSFRAIEPLNFYSPIWIYSIYIIFQYSFIYYLLKYFFNLSKLPKNIKINIKQKSLNFKVLKIANYNFLIWFGIFIFTFLIRGNIPLFSRLFGDSQINYTNFYLPTIAGFASIIRIFGSCLYLIYIINNFKDYKNKEFITVFMKFIFIFLSPLILEVSRGNQIFLTIIVFITCCSFLDNQISRKNFYKFIIFIFSSFFFLILIYSLMGIFRYQNYGDFQDMLSETYLRSRVFSSKFSYLDFLTKGKIGLITYQITLYLSGGVININSQMQNYSDLNLNFNIFAGIFPTLIRNLFFNSNSYGDLIMGEYFNVSTFLQPIFQSFGLIGALPVIFMLQFITIYSYFKSYEGSLFYRFYYPILFTSNFLAFFSNYFFTLIVILYPLLIAYFLQFINKSFYISNSNKL